MDIGSEDVIPIRVQDAAQDVYGVRKTQSQDGHIALSMGVQILAEIIMDQVGLFREGIPCFR